MYRVKPTNLAGGEERRKAQLASLQADDKDIEQIILTASHVALYELKTTGSTGPSWRKTEIEGSLYVTKRRSRPLISLMIKNQADSDEGDFSQSMDGTVVFEVKESTIFYRVGDQPTVRGLWFASKDSLSEFVSFVEKPFAKTSENSAKALMDMLARKTKKPVEAKPEAEPEAPNDAFLLLKEKLFKAPM